MNVIFYIYLSYIIYGDEVEMVYIMRLGLVGEVFWGVLGKIFMGVWVGVSLGVGFLIFLCRFVYSSSFCICFWVGFLLFEYLSRCFRNENPQKNVKII